MSDSPRASLRWQRLCRRAYARGGEAPQAGMKITAGARRALARRRARPPIAFYSNLPYFDQVLDPAGFTKEKMAIRAAMAESPPRDSIQRATHPTT